MDHDIYDTWRSLSSTTLSRDGRYLAYQTRPQVGDPDLHFVDLSTNRTTTYTLGTSPRFSHDSRFFLYTRVPSRAETEEARKARRPANEMPRNALVIVDLSSGESRTLERFGSYSLAPDGSTWITLRADAAPAGGGRGPAGRGGGEGGEGGGDQEPQQPEQDPEAKEPQKRRGHAVGRELTIHHLASGREIKIADVSDFTWSEDGSTLLYAVSSRDVKADGLFLLEPETSKTETIASGMAVYKSLAMHDGMVAYMSDARTYSEAAQSWDIYLRRVGRAAQMVVKADDDAFPTGWEVTDRTALRFSEEGRRLLYSTRPVQAAPAEESGEATPAEERVNVDIWSWNDPLIQPMQLRRVTSERNKTYAAIVEISGGRILQLETEEIPNVTIANRGDGDVALGNNSGEYGPLVSYDGTYNDYYLIELRNNRRTLIRKQARDGVSMSPSGRWLTWFDSTNGVWMARRAVADAPAVVISAKVPHALFNEQHDSPSDAGSYGSAGWTTNEDRVLVHDAYDIWALDPAGRRDPESLTRGQGRLRSVRFRLMRMGSDEVEWNLREPQTMSAFHTRSKATGFYRLHPNGNLEELLWGDARYSYSTKADDADVVVITRSRFDEYPDIWTTDSSFRNPVKRSDANPQRSEISWGTAELYEWTSADGQELQGVVYKPENYDSTKKYPMIVYFYERLSDNLHSFVSPSPGSSSVNISFYVSRGYVVFTPDIPYLVGYPGASAESAIVPGVLGLIERGIADPKRIGMQGHSWGGYQVLHLVTRTNLFACAEAGAPVANMISAYGGIRWGTGMSRQFQYEKTQSRIGGTIWDKPLQFIENSPVFWADRVNTPLLMLHNDQDGAVPWYQGIEMYMALRRLNKPVWLFNYNGEDHGLGRMPNRKDWAIRMQQFFDHYLMGAPAPVWLREGVPAIKKGEDLGLGIGG